MTAGFAATPASAVAVAPSNYNFSWAGVCSDCVGTATASLSLQNYLLGESVQRSQLVSFTYNGTNLVPAFTFLGADFSGGFIGGNLFATPGPQSFVIGRGGYVFNTSAIAPGDWSLATPSAIPADFGSVSSWSLARAGAVPEPGTWAMIIVGFGLVGLAARRRKAPRVVFGM